LYKNQGKTPQYVALPKFPAMSRDIALLVNKEITVGMLENCIRSSSKGLLRDLSLFDIYIGDRLPDGKKSVAFNLLLRADDRSLTALEADTEIAAILEGLNQELGAVLR
jgi:phenylalanyl-tRNA synthetase beta chain